MQPWCRSHDPRDLGDSANSQFAIPHPLSPLTTIWHNRCDIEKRKARSTVRKFNPNRYLIAVICLVTAAAWADSLELKNGSLINGKFVSGTESEISFQVGSSMQKYDVND